MLPIPFLLSALAFVFIDQTSIRFNLVYFLIVIGTLGLIAIYALESANCRFSKETKAFWILLLINSIFSSIIFTTSIPVSRIGLALIFSSLIFFSFGAGVKIPFRKWITVIFFLSSIVFSLISLAMAVGVIPVPANQSNLFAWTFGHNRLAGLLAILLPPSIVFVSGLSGTLLIIGGLALSIPFLTLLLSSGRAAILGFLLGLVYLNRFGPLELKKWLKLIAVVTLIPVLGLLMIPMVDRISPNSSIVKILNSDPLIHGILVKPLSNDGRFDYWNQAIRAIKALPIGWGSENVYLVLPRFRLEGEQISAYVHNQYLQAGVEMGVVGASIYILLIVLVLRQAHSTVKADASGWPAGIFAGILASAVAAFFDYDWQYPSIYLLWWFLAGTLMANGAQAPEVSSKSRWPKFVAVLSLLVLIYGSMSVFAKFALDASRKNWNSFGKTAYPGIAPMAYVLHPELGEKALSIALANLSIKQIPPHIKKYKIFFRYDNRMMEKVLRWQEAFGDKSDAQSTAILMLSNDPLNTYAKTVLEKYTPVTH